MGILKRGILGGFSKKVGPVVGGSWKGISYMRALPESVANPRTAAQVGQRTKFSTIVGIAVDLLVQIVKPLWDRFAQKQSGYNAFVSANIDQVSTAGVVNYAGIKTSIGSLPGGQNVDFTATRSTNLAVLTWEDNSGEGTALGTDEAYVAIYNEDAEEWLTQSNEVTRADLTTNLDMPAPWAEGDSLHAYLSFRRTDGTLVSTSVYEPINIVA